MLNDISGIQTHFTSYIIESCIVISDWPHCHAVVKMTTQVARD